MKPLTLCTALSLVLISACGDDERPRADAVDTAEVAPDVEVAPDAEVTADAEIAPDAEVTADAEIAPDAVDTSPDTAPDPSDADTTDADTAEVTLVHCDDFEACNALLIDGACPGTCFPTDDTLRCDGTVKHAVCHVNEPLDSPTEAINYGPFTVTPVTWPSDAVVGESADFEVRITNNTDAELRLPFRWKNPETFSFDSPSWDGVTSYVLPPRGAAVLSARITALATTTLSAGANLIVTFVFRDVDAPFEPRATVHFSATEAITCGGEHFPETYCPGEGCYASHGYYTSARCCDEVFFPGATCCDDTDCTDGACVDGKCTFNAPALGSANNVPLGHQTIRLVLIDSHPQLADPCANHYDDLKAEIDFDLVEAWYDALAQRRLGRNTVDFKWIVTGGVATTEFLTGPNTWDNYSNELNAWLDQRGCPIFDTADKVIISSSTVDLMGFGGFYTDSGHIAVFSPNSPYLLAHELAHSFGATDLYLDLAGALLYPRDLMGNNLSAPPLPGDKVTWGELAFGDLDRNGVIDLVEYAAFPETLDIANATAVITSKQSLEIRWEFVGAEGGINKRVVVPNYTLEIPPLAPVTNTNANPRFKIVTFDGTQVDLDALAAAGTVNVRIEANYRFTDRNWVYRTLSFNRTLTVPVTRQ